MIPPPVRNDSAIGIRPIYTADEALSLLLALERARLHGHAEAEMQKQALDTLKRLPE